MQISEAHANTLTFSSCFQAIFHSRASSSLVRKTIKTWSGHLGAFFSLVIV